MPGKKKAHHDTGSGRRSFMRNTGLGMIGLAAATAATHAASAADDEKIKEPKYFGLPWEDGYGYAQAVRSNDLIFVSGQLSHDEAGNFIAPASVDASGKVVDFSNMEAQMRQSYANAAKILAKFGASLSNVVEEVIYVLDMKSAFAAAGPVRKSAYGTDKPVVASTILVTPALALPQQLIEIRLVARV